MALAKTSVVTLEELLSVIQTAYSPTPITRTVENIYDVKSWLRPFTASLARHSHISTRHISVLECIGVSITSAWCLDLYCVT